VSVVRWLLLVAAAVLVIGLIAYARGPEHHHGSSVGSHGAVGIVHARS
jgi:hypothetical protein